MEAPEVRYAKSGDVNIAYSVVGDGPFDLVFVLGSVFTALEYAWEGPPGEFFAKLATFSRLIVFDKRGTGLSDRVADFASAEVRMDDIRAVMDAAGSERAAILGVSEGGPMAVLFGATYPERTAALVLYGTGASYRIADDYPWAGRPEDYERAARIREERWGDPEYLAQLLHTFAPSVADDPEIGRWWARYARTSASPRDAGHLTRMNASIDVRHALRTLQMPVLILHWRNDRVFEVEGARYMADRIPLAELVELDGADHAWFVRPEPIAREIERFLTGIWERGEWDTVAPERVLATILFTDIVDSTAKAAELGDARWRELLQQHHAVVRRQLVRFHGQEVDTAGDGFFASFDGPARAIRCADAITKAVPELGLQVRAGLHTGECEAVDGKIGGIAVHIGARVAKEAAPGEVLVSSTVRDLVAGSGLAFEERGVAELKGVPGEWRLYALSAGGA
ncbi:MAG TPA: adenylate/guanylate cyclase domain-containing protein [Gaiellaceae bacterium]|nr:adenylate/guanylate cyclase domain-containing protein [Gaiellaceae bacterium]